jgi:DNA-binding response OmpR family regulator
MAFPPVPTVLVVDDDPALAEIVAAALRAEGYAVRVAADGEAALADLWQAPPDLLLSDVMMPHSGGAELTRWARALRPGLPVVLFSAAVDGVDAEGLRVRFLPKPFDLDALVAVVAEELASPPRAGWAERRGDRPRRTS